jgi:diacylglycerol kinase (ATP)
MLAAILIPVGLWLGQDAVQRALLIGSCVLVLIVELLNTAVECVVDRIGAEHHRLSGHAKDAGSAAVLLSLSLTVLVWGLVAAERWAS